MINVASEKRVEIGGDSWRLASVSAVRIGLAWLGLLLRWPKTACPKESPKTIVYYKFLAVGGGTSGCVDVTLSIPVSLHPHAAR